MPNLNAEAHFAQSPLGVDIKRSKFDRSCSWKGSYNAGKLNCMFVDEILPGDTVDMKVSRLDRMTTPLFPVMDDAFIDQYFFFVPNRLVWSHWKEFNGENNSSAWIQPTTYVIPTIDASDSSRAYGDLAEQMGVPLPFSGGGVDYFNVNSLPFRAYRLIWNDWFRDQNTQVPKLVNTGDIETDTTLFSLLPVNRIHDRFGSALPGPQKGEAVNIALNGFLHVYPSDTHSLGESSFMTKFDGPDDFVLNDFGLNWAGYSSSSGSLSPVKSGNNLAFTLYNDGSGTHRTYVASASLGSAATNVIPYNLVAGQGAQDTLGIDVNTLRLAVQTQRILEKLSIGGSRYTEFVRSMFGVISPDARQQRPELLAHRRVHVRMNEVTQNSPTLDNTTPLGTVGAYSKTVDNNLAFTHSFTEHGYLFGLFCVRHNRSYSQGIPKMFSRKTFGDFYLPALAHIGEQPIYTYEIFADPDTVDSSEIFGYQEAWSEYRYKPSINTGLLNPQNAYGIGDVWTYGDYYTESPTLSDEWMQEGDDAIQRTLAVQDEDQFIGDVYFSYQHTRCMPVYSVPGLVDHF